MTIPTLIEKYQKKVTVTKLQKAYSSFNQGIINSMTENGPYSDWEKEEAINPTEYFNKYIKPYFKGIELCNSYKNCGYNVYNPWKELSDKTCQWTLKTSGTRTLSKTSDNTVIFIPRNTSSIQPDGTEINAYVDYFFIDINGPKNPNTIGKDVFVFRIDDKLGVKPYQNYESDINNNCSSTQSGYTCAAKIIRDGWEINDSYPW